MAAKLSVLGVIVSFPLHLRSAMVWFPLMSNEADCRTAPATPGLLKLRNMCFEAIAMCKEELFVSVFIQLKYSDPRRLDKTVSRNSPRGFALYSFLNSATLSDKSVLPRKKLFLHFCLVVSFIL